MKEAALAGKAAGPSNNGAGRALDGVPQRTAPQASTSAGPGGATGARRRAAGGSSLSRFAMSGYDAAQNSAYWNTRPVPVVARACQVSYAFGKWLLRTRMRKDDQRYAAATMREVRQRPSRQYC